MTERATSTTLSYVLTLSVATILVSGLIFAGSTFVEDRREQVVRQELQVIGEHLATNVEQVDRYADATDTLRAASLEQTFPSRVTGTTYDAILRGNGGDPTLTLTASDPAVTVEVDLADGVPITGETFADGGTIAATCQISGGNCDRIVIENA